MEERKGGRTQAFAGPGRGSRWLWSSREPRAYRTWSLLARGRGCCPSQPALPSLTRPPAHPCSPLQAGPPVCGLPLPPIPLCGSHTPKSALMFGHLDPSSAPWGGQRLAPSSGPPDKHTVKNPHGPWGQQGLRRKDHGSPHSCSSAAPLA